MFCQYFIVNLYKERVSVKVDNFFDFLFFVVMVKVVEEVGVYKVMKYLMKMFYLVIIVGVFIFIVFVFYIIVIIGIVVMFYGIVKFIGGICFFLGLILCVICGVDFFIFMVLIVVVKVSG